MRLGHVSVFLHPEVTEALRKLKTDAQSQPGDKIFGKLRKIAAEFWDALKKADIPFVTEEGRVDFHALRHTFSTHLALAKIDPRIHQELMCHSDLRLTMKGLHSRPRLADG